jgi:hypothetical protein
VEVLVFDLQALARIGTVDQEVKNYTTDISSMKTTGKTVCDA